MNIILLQNNARIQLYVQIAPINFQKSWKKDKNISIYQLFIQAKYELYHILIRISNQKTKKHNFRFLFIQQKDQKAGEDYAINHRTEIQ